MVYISLTDARKGSAVLSVMSGATKSLTVQRNWLRPQMSLYAVISVRPASTSSRLAIFYGEASNLACLKIQILLLTFQYTAIAVVPRAILVLNVVFVIALSILKVIPGR